MNAARGKNLDIRPRGSDPDHRNIWTRRAFAAFVEQEIFAKSTLVQGTEFTRKIAVSGAEWQKTPTNELKKL